MKKLLLALVLVLTASSAFAWNNGYHGGYRGGWAGPFVAGAVVGAVVTRPYYQPYYAPPVYYPPPVVYVQPQPTVYVQQPYPANEYHQEQILDANCNCYRTVLVRN